MTRRCASQIHGTIAEDVVVGQEEEGGKENQCPSLLPPTCTMILSKQIRRWTGVGDDQESRVGREDVKEMKISSRRETQAVYVIALGRLFVMETEMDGMGLEKISPCAKPHVVVVSPLQRSAARRTSPCVTARHANSSRTRRPPRRQLR